MSYRADNRTQEAFCSDILEAHTIESDIALRICQYCYKITGKWPRLESAAPDFTGGFLKDSEVTLDADFRMNGRLIEITRSDSICNKNFHQKLSKSKICAEGTYDIIFVNGYKKMVEPQYTCIKSVQMKDLIKKSMGQYGEVRHPGRGDAITFKPALKFDLSWFSRWWVLPQLEQKTLKQYPLFAGFLEENSAK